MSTCGDCEYYDAGKMGCPGSCLTLAERILSDIGVQTLGGVPVRADSPACSDFEQSSAAEALERMQADESVDLCTYNGVRPGIDFPGSLTPSAPVYRAA